MKPKLKNLLKFYKQFLRYKTYQLQHNALQEVFYSVTKLKKTNISHLFSHEFNNFPT
jgi:hypothetical protein